MKKFFLIPLMTLMCSVMAWGAVVDVAQVGDVVYKSNTALSANNPPIYKSDAAAFTAAITAANSADGQTVVLLKTIAKATSESSDEKTISANMTIDGQGQYSIPRSFTVNEGKTLTLKDVTVNDGYKSNPAGAIVLNDGATLVMNNATIAPAIGAVLPVRTVQGASGTIQLATGSTNVIRNNAGTALYTYNQTAGDNSSVLTISGEGNLTVYHTGTTGFALSANANGGNFLVSAPNVTFIPSDPTKFIGPNAKLADGYLALYENGVYKVVPTSDSRIAAVADGIAYPSIAAAVEAVPFSEIMLWADAPATTIARSVIIKSNGHNASAISAGAGYARVAIEGGYVFGKAASKSGNVYTVNNFDELWFTINHTAVDGDEIKLANDIAYPQNGDVNLLLNIQCSLILDGQGYKITGWGKCNANHDAGKTYYILTPLAINFGEEASNLDVTVENITMSTVANKTTGLHEVGLMVFDGVSKLAVESCDIRSHLVGGNNNAGIAIYGETSVALPLTIENSYIDAGADGYGLAVLKPITADFQNSTIVGYSSMTLYAPAALMEVGYRTANAFGTKNSGTRGTTITATNSNFDAAASHSGVSNAYATFALEDDGIDITLTNCGIDATNFGDAKYWGIIASPRTPLSRRSQNINITYEGDNSHINGNPLGIMWAEFQELRASYKEGAYKDLCTSGTGKTYFYIYEDGYDYYAHTVLPEVEKFSATGNFNITITGGTYDFDPSAYTYNGHIDTEAAGYADYIAGREAASMEPPFVQHHITIPATHEVKTITMDGVAMPLYRVVPKTTTLYNLNDNVQSQGGGQNPNTSFDLSTGTNMTLNQEITKAGYVEVSDKDNGEDPDTPTTVTVAKNDVNPAQSQTLVINNGLDVQGESQVIVEPTAALIIGEGGIITSKSENIIIQADEDGAASLLLDPTITVNQTPELTVKMTVPAEHAGYEMLGSDKYRHWHRFAMPVEHMDAVWAKEPNVPTYLYGWNYSAQEWAQVGVTEMVPFAGYTLSPDQEITGSNSAVTYIFKGKLLGNTNCTLNLNHHGYNFFGNSYTGYISILKLVEQIMGDAKIDGTVWMWDGEKYEGVALAGLEERPYLYESWQKEVAPMQTFVLRLTGSELSSTDINYADAIWGNPRYDAAKTALNAPARRAEINDDAIIRMTIEANGQKESVVMIENSNYSDAYDRGYDAIKYMNENSFNTYVGINGENYGTVATDNLEGKILNIKTNNELAYALTFDFVAGEEYALRDNLTGNVIAIEEGATYEFAAQPNSTVEGRFEIVGRAKMPTSIENTEVKANVKGIYTIMGQYLGEDFDILPAGVYVVNGVKIVK